MALGNLGVLITSHLFATDCVAIFFFFILHNIHYVEFDIAKIVSRRQNDSCGTVLFQVQCIFF